MLHIGALCSIQPSAQVFMKTKHLKSQQSKISSLYQRQGAQKGKVGQRQCPLKCINIAKLPNELKNIYEG